MPSIVADRLAAFEARVAREIDSGLLPSAQWAAALDGEIVAGATLGAARPDTRFVIFSATKAIIASAAWMLLAEGKLHLDAKITETIPEFGSNGKDVVTLEQVMLHTSGFPHQGWRTMSTSAERRATFADWKLNWEPGTRYEYHATTAHWVLAEMVETVSGVDYRDFVAERIATPLGLPQLRPGVPVDEQDGIATLVSVGEPPTPDELEAIFGVRSLPVTEVTPEALLALNKPEQRALGVPGGGGIMTASTLALFYQALLHNPGELWDPAWLEDVTSHVRNRLPDAILHTPANRSAGLIIAGDDGKSSLRGMGKTVSPRAFGHNGAGGQIAWADPATGLSFVYLTNGLDQHLLREGRRGVALASLAGELTTPA